MGLAKVAEARAAEARAAEVRVAEARVAEARVAAAMAAAAMAAAAMAATSLAVVDVAGAALVAERFTVNKERFTSPAIRHCFLSGFDHRGDVIEAQPHLHDHVRNHVRL